MKKSDPMTPERRTFRWNRVGALFFCLRIGLSENRFAWSGRARPQAFRCDAVEQRLQAHLRLPRLRTHLVFPSPARHAWEKVAEGRMRALSCNKRGVRQ